MLEMSMNRRDVLMDKTKLVIVKLDKLFVVIPMAMTKIEIKMRNLMINQKSRLQGISTFI